MASSQTLTLEELAQASGLDKSICELAAATGLITPVEESTAEGAAEGTELRFSPDAVEMLQIGLELLEAGLPLEELLDLAAFHASNIELVAESAVELVAQHLLPANDDLVDRLVPAVTELVAQHFQRTLVSKAAERLFAAEGSERGANAAAVNGSSSGLAATGTAHVVLERFTVEELLGKTPSTDLDPLCVYAAASQACSAAGLPAGSDADFVQSAYWSVPDDDLEMAAIGSAVELAATQLPTRFAEVDLALQNLNITSSGATRPLLLGGFTFAGNAPKAVLAPDWSAFGPGCLTLPEFLVERTNGQTSITLAAAVSSRGRSSAQVPESSRQNARELIQAALDIQATGLELLATSKPGLESLTASAPDNTYTNLVAQALSDIDAKRFVKVVTAHTLERPCSEPPAVLLDRLRQRYNSCATFAFSKGSHTFLGATPELLVRLEGTHLRTEALAGSRPRGSNPELDSALETELLTSEKERIEHEVVAQAIRKALTDAGVQLAEPAEPTIRSLPAIQHLHTPIAGGAKTHTRALELVAALHPTPAVAGTPQQAALDWIAQNETFDRGWYGAPVGWVTPGGSGEFRVALRCALLAPYEANSSNNTPHNGTSTTAKMTLFAGGGIVAGTEPQAELAEINTKFQALLSVVQPESAQPPAE